MFGIRSPLIEKLLTQNRQKFILIALRARFGSVPHDVETAVRGVQDEPGLDALISCLAVCPDLEAFRTRLFEHQREQLRKRESDAGS